MSNLVCEFWQLLFLRHLSDDPAKSFWVYTFAANVSALVQLADNGITNLFISAPRVREMASIALLAYKGKLTIGQMDTWWKTSTELPKCKLSVFSKPCAIRVAMGVGQ